MGLIGVRTHWCACDDFGVKKWCKDFLVRGHFGVRTFWCTYLSEEIKKIKK